MAKLDGVLTFAKTLIKRVRKGGRKVFLFFMVSSLVFYLFNAKAIYQVSNAETASSGLQTAIITILDLDSDGIKTRHYKSGTYFDYDSTGFAEQTGWADKNDGVLVYDLNNDGVIDSGKEVFGNFMVIEGKSAKGGLLLLKELDHNRDERIDIKDEIFLKLRIWQDFNGDGVSHPDELFTLRDLRIEAILLNYKDVNTVDHNGNRLIREAMVESRGGERGQ